MSLRLLVWINLMHSHWMENYYWIKTFDG